MICRRNALLLALVLITVPFLWSQTSSDSVTLKRTVGETTLLSNKDFHIWLQNGATDSEVCLGPAQFLRDQGAMPNTGDTVEVTGTWVGNRGVLRADTLQIGGRTLSLARTYAGGGCPGCGGHNCGYHGCGAYHHGCGHGHQGHCCDHE